MIEIRHEGIDNTKNSSIAYDQIYKEKGILHPDSFYLMLLDLLRPQHDKVILDMSCGVGRLAYLARQKYSPYVIGVDISFIPLLSANKFENSIYWINGDGEKLPIRSGSIDYLFNIGSIEHYFDPAKGIQEIARVLKPDGKACILLPNLFGLLGNIKYVSKFGEAFDDGQPLQRYATISSWKNLITKNGLKITRIVGFNEVQLPRTRSDLIKYIIKPQKFLRLLFSNFIPINLSNHFIFICEPNK